MTTLVILDCPVCKKFLDTKQFAEIKLLTCHTCATDHEYGPTDNPLPLKSIPHSHKKDVCKCGRCGH